jgi:hypothetical protein
MNAKLEKFLKSLIEKKEGYDKPLFYQEEEYYDACRAKSQLLDELIDEVRQLIKEDF